MISYMIVRTYDTLDSVREDLRSSDLKMAIHSFMNINIGITYDLIASGDPSFAFAASPNLLFQFRQLGIRLELGMQLKAQSNVRQTVPYKLSLTPLATL